MITDSGLVSLGLFKRLVGYVFSCLWWLLGSHFSSLIFFFSVVLWLLAVCSCAIEMVFTESPIQPWFIECDSALGPAPCSTAPPLSFLYLQALSPLLPSSPAPQETQVSTLFLTGTKLPLQLPLHLHCFLTKSLK